MSKKRVARAVADVAAGTVLASVEIAAPPERVYRALTDPNEIVKWWGADEHYRTTTWTSELAAGGRWRAEGKGADGVPFSVEGEYVELDPPKKIVCTWKAAWDGGNTTTITYRIEPTADGSRVVVRHEGFGERADSCRGHADGWERVLTWLTLGVTGKNERRYFLIRLLPPRPTFIQDMTAEERAMMTQHGAYWREQLAAGHAVVFGPVLDPKGPWGLGVVRVTSEDQLRAFEADDPAVTSGGMRYEVLPMASAVHG